LVRASQELGRGLALQLIGVALALLSRSATLAPALALRVDPDLVRMYNERDVYVAMSHQYYADEIPTDDRDLPDKIFKKRHRHQRDRMKEFTLATIYNITAYGLALRLGVTPRQAADERERFLGMFPTLARALREASHYGVIRGYASLCTGLRRWRAGTGAASNWEINWMRNTPVQGSASVVFKVAGNRLDRRYAHLGARLILPMHDAFVFEAPMENLTAAAKVTAEVMRSTVQEYFPCLVPQVDVNIDHPHCWNKEGKYRSLDLWMVHPKHARGYL
jgi:DNA polymerase-1